MKRIIAVLSAMAIMAAMMVAMAMPAFAQEPPQGLTNFGQCAATEAQLFPPGPAKGEDQSLARVFNPAGTNLQCPVANGEGG